MKEHLIKSLLAVACLMSSISASAQRIAVDSICYYILSDSTCQVASNPSDKYRGNIVIPGKIRYAEFYEYTVVEVGATAFMDCADLTGVTIPNTVTTIGTNAFKNCVNLSNVTIGNSVTEIPLDAFYGCSSLKSVTIPNSVTKLGSRAFRNSGLENVMIGNGVTEIGQYTFADCNNLKSVSIPNSVVTILRGAFMDCSQLEYVKFEDGDATVVCHDYSNSIFEGCPIASAYAGRYIDSGGSNYPPFRGISTLKEVTIGDSVSSLWLYAFYGCENLESVTMGNSITEIGTQAFGSCTGLTDVTIGSAVAKIGIRAFDNCTNLKNVTFSDSVTEIGEYAFNDCSSLVSMTLPNSVTMIDGSAFKNCIGLESITMGNSVAEIGKEAFGGCSSLASVTMNSSPEIGYYVFRDCDALTTIYSLSVMPPSFKNSSAFSNDHYKTVNVYVPQEALAAYQSTFIWKNFLNLQAFDPAGIDPAKATDGKATYYDLRGYRLTAPKRGLNIVDGKKVFIK